MTRINREGNPSATNKQVETKLDEGFFLPALPKADKFSIEVGRANALVKLLDDLNTCWRCSYPAHKRSKEIIEPTVEEFFPPFTSYGVALYKKHSEVLLVRNPAYSDYSAWLNFALKKEILECIAPCRPLPLLDQRKRRFALSEWWPDRYFVPVR